MTAVTSWDSDSLLQKAKLYIARAQAEDRDGPLFPMWLTLALELLGRSALSRVNPALLADPRDENAIMYAVGHHSKGRSVAAITVFRRCHKIVPNFTEQDLAFVTALMDRRNEELHSGALAFENWPTAAWLAGYYRICSNLAKFLGIELDEVLGTAEADAASAMIRAEAHEVADAVRQLIADAAAHWSEMSDDDRRLAAMRAPQVRPSTGSGGIRAKCPACGNSGWMSGEVVAESAPKADEGEMVQELAVLPTQFTCPFCALKLTGYEALHAAGWGGQYTVSVSYDPVEFFNIDWRDFDIDVDELIAQRYGEDYGND